MPRRKQVKESPWSKLREDIKAHASKQWWELLSIDEAHTIATALGNTIKKLSIEETEQRGNFNRAASFYMNICKEDAEKLLHELNKRFTN